MINVTKPFLPPIEEYVEKLYGIWDKNWLTNQGPYVQELEEKLKDKLGLEEHINYVTNGTVAIQLALQAMELSPGDEIITTPFSYVATTSAILLEKCNPVFVDIDPCTFQINPDLLEDKITEKTKAILAVHVYGIPSNVEKIQTIAKKYNLKVIYDAAHAFGVIYKGKSLLSYGDISTCSFHATKLFHTVEGGCLVTNSMELHEKISLKLRFGHNADEHICLGTNAKASEFHAAMGLVNLNYVDKIILERKRISEKYDYFLKKYVDLPLKPEYLQYNYAYYPIILPNEKTLLKVISILNENKIYPRRYFYPSLNNLPYLETSYDCPISQEISKRILSLPLYPELDDYEIEFISNLIIGVI